MNTTGNTGNSNYLQRFAVKSSKRKTSENLRCVIYNRCSSEKQDSLQWQEEQCEIVTKEKKLELIKVFGAKESAQFDDRVVFLEMLNFCYKENIGHIVVYSYDRFTRSGDIGLLKQLRDKGIKVHAVSQRVDDDTPSGRFIQDMYVLFAKMENDDRRAKIILGQKAKLRRGELIGSPTIGYEKRYVTGKKEHLHDKRQCFINKDGEKLRQAFYWKALEKLRNREIKARLEKMGLKISDSELTRIFKNIFYIGYITSKMLDEGEIIRGKHEPLVSEEIFFRANGIAQETKHGWSKVSRGDEMFLKASVQCDKCNRPLTAYPQRQGAYLYYKCPNRGCNVNVRNLKLHDLFAAELSKLTIPDTMGPVIMAQLELTYWTLHRSDVARVKPMKDELTRLKNELEQMELNLVTSKITAELYEKFSKSHKQKINEIEETIGNVSDDSSNLDKMLKNATKLSSNLLNTWTLLDYSGKVRLQKLVFPEGLRYNRENHAFRTPKINPILSAISSISIINDTNKNSLSTSNDENLRSLLWMFGSSNFFIRELKAIADQFSDLKHCIKDHYLHEFPNLSTMPPIFNSTTTTQLYNSELDTYCTYNALNSTGSTLSSATF